MCWFPPPPPSPIPLVVYYGGGFEDGFIIVVIGTPLASLRTSFGLIICTQRSLRHLILNERLMQFVAQLDVLTSTLKKDILSSPGFRRWQKNTVCTICCGTSNIFVVWLLLFFWACRFDSGVEWFGERRLLFFFFSGMNNHCRMRPFFFLDVERIREKGYGRYNVE